MKYWPILTAPLIVLSGFLFDSEFVKAFSVPYPIVFLALGSVLGSFLAVPVFNKYGPKAAIYFVLMCFSGFIAIGTYSSIGSDVGDFLALGMKVSTIILNFVFFALGFLLQGSTFEKEFSKWTLFLSFALSIPISLVFLDKINPNWIAITLTYAILLYILSKNKTNWFLLFAFCFILATYAWLVFSARGVTLAAAFGMVYLLLSAVFVGRIKKLFSNSVIIVLPILSIAGGFLGVWLYNSDIYPILNALSLEFTGKNFDSSRLERWDVAAELFFEKPILGWGIDAHVSRATGFEGYGDLHNLWWEFLFRGGILGASVFFMIIAYLVIFMVKRKLYTDSDVVAFIFLFTLMSVYALGGVTHWPGSYLFWFVYGLLLRRAVGMGNRVILVPSTGRRPG